MKQLVVIFLLLTAISNSPTFSHPPDSLSVVIAQSANDSIKAAILLKHAATSLSQMPDSAIKILQEAYQYAVKYGQYSLMIDIKSKMGILSATHSDYLNALKYFQQALKLSEDAKDEPKISSAYTNIANIYVYLSMFEKANEYYSSSIEIKEKLKDKKGIANTLNNVGRIYEKQENISAALEAYEKALNIFEELNDIKGISATLLNLGGIYTLKKNYNIALAYFDRALKLKQELNDPVGIMRAENNLGFVNVLTGNHKKGIELCQKSLEESKELGHLEGIQYNCECLYVAYDKMKDNKNAYFYFKEYIVYRDSVVNTQKLQDITRQEMLLDFTRQMYVDSMRRTEQQKVKELELQKEELKKEEELKRQKLYTYSGIAGFLLMIVLAVVLYRGYNTKKKANEMITKQKTEVESQKEIVQEKNKEILDSIRYAQRIQEALLPDDNFIKDCLPDSFIFYKPRDIVSGDFYWINKTANKIQFAVVDCTGHGVPGAFMSIIGYNGLNRCIGEYGLTKPNEILDALGNIIRNALSQHKQNNTNVYDGMDIALCSLDTKTLILEYAGANCPLYFIQNQNLITCKADIQPVGAFIESKLKPFKLHSYQLQKNDIIYLFSDGFADQFGGEKGKKFKYENFRTLLSSISSKSLAEQQQIITDTFENWKGNLEQVDDVCVIGVRV
ncbi:MAG: tetratricopeptide repeat protein [Bacteroidetes bacterium]|nr:hypothetical protein [Bacteroidota bacterium]MBV6461791.1 Photosystem I assembly protein Ycf3 [Flavobacteriales bacterium]WKZ75905.1 MAG: tetratricopeptide repeat protein [Vicingaceae bacterium]MCL4816716.1 tetratricopeptide repeat protein [Flavobacteriales bacterium]NOG95582.1 tetratricopeptide repeat protein [Bacteroidota bacterium]